MQYTCPHCTRVIEVKQDHPYHAGFNNVGVLYCERCSGTLIFSTFDVNYHRHLGTSKKHPWALNEQEKSKIESHLISCTCGGLFRFDAPPRCPHCNNDIANLLKDKIYYLELGHFINGEKINPWKD